MSVFAPNFVAGPGEHISRGIAPEDRRGKTAVATREWRQASFIHPAIPVTLVTDERSIDYDKTRCSLFQLPSVSLPEILPGSTHPMRLHTHHLNCTHRPCCRGKWSYFRPWLALQRGPGSVVTTASIQPVWRVCLFVSPPSRSKLQPSSGQIFVNVSLGN